MSHAIVISGPFAFLFLWPKSLLQCYPPPRAPRQRINVASLVHKVGEARLKDACPVLSRFLESQSILKQMGSLPDIVRLQLLLNKSFAQTLESSAVSAVNSLNWTLFTSIYVHCSGLYISSQTTFVDMV